MGRQVRAAMPVIHFAEKTKCDIIINIVCEFIHTNMDFKTHKQGVINFFIHKIYVSVDNLSR